METIRKTITPETIHEEITLDVESGNAVTRVKELINSHDVVVFSKTFCPYSTELKRTLSSYGVHFSVLEINKTHVMHKIQDALKEISGISTVPNLFIKGESKGGCADIKHLEFEGKLLPLLAPYVTDDNTVKTSRVPSQRLFYFPEVVNADVIRLTAALLSMSCAFCVGFYHSDTTKWAILGIAIDCTLRFIFGPMASGMSLVAYGLLIYVKPRYIVGPPKQFAASFAVFLSAFAAALALAGERIGGTVVIAVLFGITFIESVFNFCFGSWLFELAIDLALISPDIYRSALNLVEEQTFAYNFVSTRSIFPKPVREHILLPEQKEETPVDLIRKNRLEMEYKNQHVDLIGNTRVDLFAIPMTISTLAYAYKLTQNGVHGYYITLWNTGIAYQVLSIASIIVFGFICLLYILKTLKYPWKVIKEYHHPVLGNYFSAVNITILLYAFAYINIDIQFSGVLIWIGTTAQLILTLFKISSLVFDYQSRDLVNPSVMMIPVGLYICAIGFFLYHSHGGPNYHQDINYLYLGRIWYGIASLFAIVLFTITYEKSWYDHHSDNRLRPNLWVWLATSSVAGVAHLGASDVSEPGRTLFFQSLYAISLLFASVLGIGWVRGFFSYPTETDMSIWIMPFSCCTFALITLQYFFTVKDPVSRVIAIIALVTASGTTGVASVITVTALLDMSLFKSRSKWNPASFIMLTHEAFRFSISKIANLMDALNPTQTKGLEVLAKQLEELLYVMHEHAVYKNNLLFPAFRRFHPGINPTMEEELGQLNEYESKFEVALESYRSNKDGEQLLSVLSESFKAWGELALSHFRHEEKTASAAIRKYIPLEIQAKITDQIFSSVSIETWYRIFPFVINNLSLPTFKVRFVRAFIWANPARAHEVGLIAYRTLDSVTWNFLAQEIPEISPRGTFGYKRIY